ncbi:hypothetical protein CGRA01v4_03812 [Colletotrichum graminicola]|uniref:Zinc-binding dehydrogenase n=1 Tax=Colletotrichum graminicola (strain M1.001 / M2 / FGSC 10212) TaxID=645133 RepID=E3QGA7_COLGM|nr:uncharacterized protein GLRG_04847 [Colletotrichum graminicola M1.001]EFQ29703.1 hypothetical protein GLRG_04847 [Colletotrichum graminicola M1.001]WDK12532.1 hypothetical protein CGRA01v4_03812 [Colletotrichum graminicola]
MSHDRKTLTSRRPVRTAQTVAYAALNPGGQFYISLIPRFARASTAVPEMDLSGTVTQVWSPGSASGPAATTSRTMAKDASPVDDAGPENESLRERFGREGSRFDAVVDCVGVQDVHINCAAYLVPDGVYSALGIKPAALSYGAFTKVAWQMQMNALWSRPTWLGGTGRRWAATAMMDPGKDLTEEVMGMLSDGRIKSVIEKQVGFEQVANGYDIVGSGRARGKVVVKVDGE